MGNCHGCACREDQRTPREAGGTPFQQDPLEDVEVQLPAPEQECDWVRLGGTELEEALTNEWVKLVRADWLIERAKTGGAIARRQDMPLEAYVGLDELKKAGSGGLEGQGDNGKWLRVIVLSCPWLQPGHPDPHGENLRHVANVLKCFVHDSNKSRNGGKPYGVLIDFTALFQVPRTKQENEIFVRALPALSVFYSHPNTVVLMVTELPVGYPHHPSFHYELPKHAHTAAYSKRGWCFAESAMSCLAKASVKVLDVGRYTNNRGNLEGLIESCKTGRVAPLHPDDFKEALDKKTFTSKKSDFERVAALYAAAFEQHLGSATELDYRHRGWGADSAQRLARALRGGHMLQSLKLDGNRIGGEGALAIVEALQHNTSLALCLGRNGIGQQGTITLAAALQANGALQTLELGGNRIGQPGAVALGQALQMNIALRTLDLRSNDLGREGAAALGEALQSNSSLQQLGLQSNDIGDEGVVALRQPLLTNRTLQSLELGCNGIGGKGAAALGEVLQGNRSLQTLRLQDNRIGVPGAAALGAALLNSKTLLSLDLCDNLIGAQGAAALGEALQSNSSLQTLNLMYNGIGDQGAAALGVALESNCSLETLHLNVNRIGDFGALALAQALHINRSLQMLDLASNKALRSLQLGHNDISSEAVDVLRETARARPTPLELRV